jgi:hypothetical protein
MGGFTALVVNSVDRRPRATFAMCPMYGTGSMVPQVRRLTSLLRVEDWGRPVPTSVLGGELDPMVRAEDLRALHERLAPPKSLVLVARAGHVPWADGAQQVHEQYRQGYLSGAFPDPEIDAIALGTAMRPFAELCTEEQAGVTARALCLAHLDLHLGRNERARTFLEVDLANALETRGVSVEIHV